MRIDIRVIMEGEMRTHAPLGVKELCHLLQMTYL